MNLHDSQHLRDKMKASSPSLDDPRVIEALEEYLTALETGQKPDRRLFLARHADIARPLAECLDGLEGTASRRRAGPEQRAEADVNAAEELARAGTLGDFRIVGEVGRGGMGIVYEAEQMSLGRRVALKVLPLAATLDSRHLQRFHNEARAAACLHHEHIVPVYSVGSERGVHFYAMQFIDGFQGLPQSAAMIGQLRQQAGLAFPAAAGAVCAERPASPEGVLKAPRARVRPVRRPWKPGCWRGCPPSVWARARTSTGRWRGWACRQRRRWSTPTSRTVSFTATSSRGNWPAARRAAAASG